MQLQHYYLYCLYIIFYQTCCFSPLEALVGETIRSAEEYEFLFIVAIAKIGRRRNIRRYFFCTGSLISRRDILTSEHCLSDERLEGIHAVVGSSYMNSGTRHYPAWWISYDQWAVHNNYEYIDLNNDIGILQMIVPADNAIQPAHIYVSQVQSLYGMEAKIAGWGRLRNHTIPNTLQVGTVTILSMQACEQQVSRVAGHRVEGDYKTICSSANPYVLLHDGDSGGPIFRNNLLIGVSHGTAPDLRQDIHPETVNTHIHITYYYDFICDQRNEE